MFSNHHATFVPDPHSFARPTEAVVRHLELDIQVNFDQQLLAGSATYLIDCTAAATEIIFDTRELEIEKVLLDGCNETTFALGEPKPYLGQPLIVQLSPGTQSVTIFYQTTAGAAALQWLNPAQTAGKENPFLFTQSQAILARTWLPCQDSPGIRFTYHACVQVPPAYLALMSAENPQVKSPDGQYSFAMRQPIPAYLLALAVGDLAFKEISYNTGIYAEPVMLKTAYQEFAELPNMLQAAETLYGPYLWDRYDLLLLPPSFPFGGMENPRLTFVTPTIITGDRSLTSLIAHELAHSWSGNLVTNATWNDFWLNEGFTVYFERRIMEVLYGTDYADMLKVLGIQDLHHTVAEIGPENPDTHLKLNLANRDPDEGLTEIAYEKGNLFLLKLEQVVGRELFDAFVRNYFQHFSFQAMHTEQFLQYLRDHLLSVNPAFGQQVNPEEWIYKPGIPDEAPNIKSGKFELVKQQADKWQAGIKATELKTQNWTTHEWLYFLRLIAQDLTAAKMQELDQIFKFTFSGNAEILSLWFENAIRLQYTAANQPLESFLMQVGRRKFIAPLYKVLLNQNKDTAKAIYAKARPNYHAVATSTLDTLLLT